MVVELGMAPTDPVEGERLSEPVTCGRKQGECLLGVLESLVRVVLAPQQILVVNSGLCGEGEFEAGQVAGSSSVQLCAVPERFESDQVERAGHEDVVEVGLG